MSVARALDDSIWTERRGVNSRVCSDTNDLSHWLNICSNIITIISFARGGGVRDTSICGILYKDRIGAAGICILLSLRLTENNENNNSRRIERIGRNNWKTTSNILSVYVVELTKNPRKMLDQAVEKISCANTSLK